jgi:hypothetical protein
VPSRRATIGGAGAGPARDRFDRRTQRAKSSRSAKAPSIDRPERRTEEVPDETLMYPPPASIKVAQTTVMTSTDASSEQRH